MSYNYSAIAESTIEKYENTHEGQLNTRLVRLPDGELSDGQIIIGARYHRVV